MNTIASLVQRCIDSVLDTPTLLRKTLLTGVASLALLGPNLATAANDRGAYDYGTFKTAANGSSWVNENGNSTWMKMLPDTTPLTKLSIPGTHDSVARYNSSAELDWGWSSTDDLAFAADQWMTIEQQLQFGVRFLDLRFRHIKNNLQGHHGLVYQGISASNVLSQIEKFLKNNPSETVLIRVKEEYTASGNSRTFADTYNAIANQYPSLFWRGSGTPTLGEVRGKVVLLQNFSGTVKGALNYQSIMVQDNYDVPTLKDLPAKVKSIKDFAEKANATAGDGKVFYLNFLSGAGTWMRSWKVASAQTSAANGSNFINGYQGTNYAMKEWMDTKNPTFVGIVAMDFPGPSIVKAIIKLNK